MSSYAVDPFAAAADATIQPRDVFGQCRIDAWFCVLARGVGREPYDPKLHRPEERRTAIDVYILPLPELGLKQDVFRKMLAESKEWAAIVLPSLKKLGIQNPKELNEKWVRVQYAPTGRTYVSQTGETKEATTLKFVALYDSEQACRTAWDASGNGAQTDEVLEPTVPTPAVAAPPSENNAERSTAYEFLKVLVKQSGGDQGKLATLIQGVPTVAKYFKETSTEAYDLMKAEQRR